MLRLKTLGNAFIIGESGQALSGAAAQRRTLALLAALAVAGEGGLSRDKLVGLLWPEADPDRARHSLTQALYAARRALGADDLFLVNADVRLNRARIGSDVQELETALGAGDLERAAALYTGPFLDGFFLAGSPEFEHWSSLQRARLEARVTEALEQLAERAESQGDHRRSIECRRRIAVIRPFDSGNALELMKSLMESGDRAGALQHARLHELMLREQLDLDPDPAVVALAAELREPTVQWPSRSRGATSVTAASPGTTGTSGAAALTHPNGAPLPASTLGSRGWMAAELRTHRTQLAASLVVLVALLAGSLLLIGERRASPPPPPPLEQKVVVAPFRVVGATSALGYLRDGMVELLSIRLADDTAARSVDAGAVLRAWDEAGVTGSATLPRDSIVRLAAKLGAERVVIGSVIGTPSRLIVRASVAAVPSGAVHGEAIVEGPADSISSLIDGLAAKLLLAEAGEDERLASYTTSSLRALRPYLAGQAALRQNRYGEAIRHYRRALDRDPAFALAALQLAIAADRLNEADEKQQGIALAWGSRQLLSERDLAVLVGFSGPRYPNPSLRTEQLTAWRRLVELAPNNAESWYLYGAHIFHSGALAGVAAPEEQSFTLMERALTIDPDHVPAQLLRTHLSTGAPPDSLDRDQALAADSSHPFAPYLRWRQAVAGGDSTSLRRVRSTIRAAGPANLRMIAMASQFDAMNLADGALALRILQSRPKTIPDQVDLILAQHSLALLQGQPRAAIDATTRLARVQPGAQGFLRLRVLDALYAEGDMGLAAEAAGRLASLTDSGTGMALTSEPRLSNVCTTGQWRLSRGDTVGVGTAINVLRSGRINGPITALNSAPAVCGELLDTWVAVLSRRRDALGRLERLDSLVLTPEVAGDVTTYAPLLVARLYESVGQPSRALQAIRKRVYMSGWPRYLATAWREEGRLAEVTGDRGAARQAYERYLDLRVSPERDVLPQVNQVRSARNALQTEAS